MLRSARTLSTWALGLALPLAAAIPAAHAQAWPSKPLRLVIAFGPGGIADTTSRVVAEKLGDKLGQRIVVENMPGGGGIAAARAALNAPADGHTLALLTNGNAIAVALFKSLPYDPLKDFVQVSRLGYFEFFFATRSDGPYKTLGDVIAKAKAEPGKLNVGTINPGSTQHLTALLLKSTAGIQYQWVPFKTTPDLLIALIRGDIDMAVDGWTALKGNIDDGKLRALAASSAQRSPAVPTVPGAKEAGGGAMDVVSWNALAVKAGTPPEIVTRLYGAVREALTDAGLKKRLVDLGITAGATTSEEMTQMFKADIERWGDVIAKNNIEKQ